MCVFSNVFQFGICLLQLQERTFRVMLSVQMELPPVMCLSDQGLKRWGDRQADLEFDHPLGSLQLTQAGFAGASRLLHSCSWFSPSLFA